MHFIILAIFLGLAAIIVWVADYTPSAADDAPQRWTFSIGALPAARSTGPSTTRSAS